MADADAGRIVASIKTASGQGTGNRPADDVVRCIAELYFLSLVRADQRQLVLTSLEFCSLFTGAMKLPSGVEVVHLPLPPNIQGQVEGQRWSTSDDVVPVLDKKELKEF